MSTVDTIAGLLAMAERTTNEHEADAFLTKAQTLATLAAIDLEVARTRIGRREERQQPVTRTITIGDAGKRANRHLVSLFVAVAHANDVVLDVARNSTYVVAYGMPSDIDTVSTLWTSLGHQMVAAANAHLAGGAWRTETYEAVETRIVGRYRLSVPVAKPHTSQTARAAFYQGFIGRIRHRLTEARETALKGTSPPERPAGDLQPQHDPPPPGGGALVLKAKADEVRAFHQQESRARGSWQGYSGAGLGDRGTSVHAGRAAAGRARIGTARGIGGQGAALPSPRDP